MTSATATEGPQPMLDRYVHWVREAALPRWASSGFDPAAGRFRERLDFQGSPLDVPHRSMVQARQIFVFAHAARCGWSDDGGTLAERAMAALVRDFAEDAGDETSFAFSIAPAGAAIVSSVRDAYAHAFVLFSIAALYALNGDPKLLDLADRTIRFVGRKLGDPLHGGLFDALPPPDEKRQNPHMHLLEAYLFLERAAPGRGYLEKATELVELFRRRFFVNERLLEYFGADWAPSDRAVWEPGHHFEWVWLLAEYRSLTGNDLASELHALYEPAMTRGVASNGLIVDELAAGSDRVVKGSHRLWPHTEAIKAAATCHAAGDHDARGFADRMADGLLSSFLDRPFEGGWTDQLTETGAPLVNYVPASSLYHLLLAATVAAEGFAAAPALAKADQ